MKSTLPLLLALGLAACASEATEAPSAASDLTGEARASFSKDFRVAVEGQAKAGGALVIDYDLDRLTKCRGNVGGGGPAWTITGFYSENGGASKMFEVSALTPDGKDRVAKPGRIPLTQGGDVAVWFQNTSGFGCSEFDSQFGQNYHFDVAGPAPTAEAAITFHVDGKVEKTGTLKAGGKVKVRYEQDRLPQCRRVQGGMPQWSISGFASQGGADPVVFSTGRPVGPEREAVDAFVDLPNAGELALWFEVVSVGGCHEVDSQGGANYRFAVEP